MVACHIPGHLYITLQSVVNMLHLPFWRPLPIGGAFSMTRPPGAVIRLHFGNYVWGPSACGILKEKLHDFGCQHSIKILQLDPKPRTMV